MATRKVMTRKKRTPGAINARHTRMDVRRKTAAMKLTNPKDQVAMKGSYPTLKGRKFNTENELEFDDDDMPLSAKRWPERKRERERERESEKEKKRERLQEHLKLERSSYFRKRAHKGRKEHQWKKAHQRRKTQ